MKKLLAIALIAASFTACNGDKKTEETTVGSDTTMTTVPSAPDTLKTVTDTMVKTTTIKTEGGDKMSDTSKMKMDKKN